MAIVYVDDKLLDWMPDYFAKLEKMVGKLDIRNSIVLGVYEVRFNDVRFESNQIVVTIVTYNEHKNQKLITGIRDSMRPFYRYEKISKESNLKRKR